MGIGTHWYPSRGGNCTDPALDLSSIDSDWAEQRVNRHLAKPQPSTLPEVATDDLIAILRQWSHRMLQNVHDEE